MFKVAVCEGIWEKIYFGPFQSSFKTIFSMLLGYFISDFAWKKLYFVNQPIPKSSFFTNIRNLANHCKSISGFRIIIF